MYAVKYGKQLHPVCTVHREGGCNHHRGISTLVLLIIHVVIQARPLLPPSLPGVDHTQVNTLTKTGVWYHIDTAKVDYTTQC